jgi:hypothetical protein
MTNRNSSIGALTIAVSAFASIALFWALVLAVVLLGEGSSLSGSRVLNLSEGQYGLIGVGVGFALSFGADRIKARQRLKSLRSALAHELDANLRIVHEKRRILAQVEELIPKGRLLPPNGVRFVSVVYFNHFPELSSHITQLDRNSLHVIYESQRIFDDLCEAMDRQLTDLAVRNELRGAMTTFLVKLPDLKDQLSMLDKLLAAHISGNPIDVLHTGYSIDFLRKV